MRAVAVSAAAASLLYDGTVPAVPGVVDALKQRGYVFVTVPQLPAPGRAEAGEVYRQGCPVRRACTPRIRPRR